MLVKCLSKGKNTIAWLELNILQGSFWESPSDNKTFTLLQLHEGPKYPSGCKTDNFFNR